MKKEAQKAAPKPTCKLYKFGTCPYVRECAILRNEVHQAATIIDGLKGERDKLEAGLRQKVANLTRECYAAHEATIIEFIRAEKEEAQCKAEFVRAEKAEAEAVRIGKENNAHKSLLREAYERVEAEWGRAVGECDVKENHMLKARIADLETRLVQKGGAGFQDRFMREMGAKTK